MHFATSCVCIRCYAPQQPQPPTTLLWQRCVRIIAETATAAVFVRRPALNRGAALALLVPMAELPTTGIGPIGVAVTLAPLSALQVLVTTVTLAVFKAWGQTRFQRH
jgi:hypothetical protein